MSDIKDNISSLKAQLPQSVKLIAVSKTFPSVDIADAYEGGQRDFGESKVQELMAKYDELPKDIRWHMIGHLQTNKVKYIAPFVHLIHSVDSVKLLEVINKEARKCSRVIDVLLEVHVADGDENKTGFTSGELLTYLSSGSWRELTNVRITGLMTVASNTDDTSRVKADFQSLASLQQTLVQQGIMQPADFRELSMGMTHDYQLAVESGSTMVRVGNGIFGKRFYQTNA